MMLNTAEGLGPPRVMLRKQQQRLRWIRWRSSTLATIFRLTIGPVKATTLWLGRLEVDFYHLKFTCHVFFPPSDHIHLL